LQHKVRRGLQGQLQRTGWAAEYNGVAAIGQFMLDNCQSEAGPKVKILS
jgi:hypothetical protein